MLAEPPALIAKDVRLQLAMKDVAAEAAMSLRYIKGLDSRRDIPGRRCVGRAVRFRADLVRTWILQGMPPRDRWPASLIAADAGR